MKELTGALYFYDDHIIGHLKIGRAHFQISGVRVGKIRASITARQTGEYQQEDLFDDGSGAANTAADTTRRNTAADNASKGVDHNGDQTGRANDLDPIAGTGDR